MKRIGSKPTGNSAARELRASGIEMLESRIAPASVLHLTDANGDIITLTTSLGTLTDIMINTTLLPDGHHDQFTVNLFQSMFNGTNLTVTVRKGPHGDGQLANLIVDADGNNLGAVSIAGDLGYITAGSGSATVPAIKSLTVNSIGRYEGENGTLETSSINGSISKLAIKGDMDGTFLDVSENIGSISIGGSLIGGSGTLTDDGDIFAGGNIGKVSIRRDVTGGSGEYDGIVAAYLDMGAVAIGGSVYGGSGEYSASIGGGTNTTSVAVGGSVIGGVGEYSGDIYAAFHANGTLGKVTLGGSLIGGAGEGSGMIGYSEGGGGFNVSVTTVVIGRDIVAGGALFTGDVYADGGTIGSLTLKGSLIGGTNSNSDNSGLIVASGTQQSGVISIGGSIYGGEVGFVNGSVDRIIIGGSVYGGDADASGIVLSGETIGLLEIRGDVIGGAGPSSGAVQAAAVTTLIIDGVVVPGTGTNSGTVTT